MTQYIYILINPSLAGMLKIGRTNRFPEQRASELSRNTNMPTPFMVAYEEEVKDSELAEKLIHEELTEQGFRITDSREFFSIPLKTAIQVVAKVARQMRDLIPSTEKDFDQTDIEENSLAEYYLQQGIDALGGSENTLQDFYQAKAFLEKANALGSIGAPKLIALYTSPTIESSN
jgi:hypothetical protein